jgi:hypothetical protein
MTPKTLRIADAANTAGLTYQTLWRLSLNFNCCTEADFEAWRNTEYTEDVHLVLQLYLHLIKHLPCAGTVCAVLTELCQSILDKTSSYHATASPRVVCVADGRFLKWPGLNAYWWDTWRNGYIESDHADVTPLYITTAIHLDAIVTLPLKQQA